AMSFDEDDTEESIDVKKVAFLFHFSASNLLDFNLNTLDFLDFRVGNPDPRQDNNACISHLLSTCCLVDIYYHAQLIIGPCIVFLDQIADIHPVARNTHILMYITDELCLDF
ncbi:hypothetical protein ACJX0J_011603, partial [Zea mays]